MRRRNGLVAIVAASALWGASGGVVAGIQANGVAAACLVELVTGVTLLFAAGLAGAPVRTALSSLSWWLLLLAVLEAVNASLYYLALHLAPLGVVIALHLTSPLLLAIAEVITGRRATRPRDLISVIAASAAIVLIGLMGHGGNGPSLVGGLALSVTSAGCIAMFSVIVRGLASQTSSAAASGLQTLCSGILLAPSLPLLRGHTGAVAPLSITAIVLFAPACWCYWQSLRHLEAIAAATVQLSEPIFGAAAALIVFRVTPRPVDGLAVALILVAAWLELTREQAAAGSPRIPNPRRRDRDRN